MAKRTGRFELNRQRGLVLPTVLWISVLAITIGVSYDNVKTALLLKYDAISGVYLAIDQLLARPVSETTHYRLDFNGSELAIEVTPESAKTRVNTASVDEIRGAISAAGIDAGSARMLAARIVDWRDAENRGYGAKDSRIEDLSELLLIADIERQAFLALSSRLTSYDGAAGRLYSITVTSSRGDQGPIFITSAVIRLTVQQNPYRILKWQHNHG